MVVIFTAVVLTAVPPAVVVALAPVLDARTVMARVLRRIAALRPARLIRVVRVVIVYLDAPAARACLLVERMARARRAVGHTRAVPALLLPPTTPIAERLLAHADRAIKVRLDVLRALEELRAVDGLARALLGELRQARRLDARGRVPAAYLPIRE